MTLGQTIRRRRKAAGLTQEQAARRIARRQGWWARIEADGQSPSVRTLRLIARALGCAARDLL